MRNYLKKVAVIAALIVSSTAGFTQTNYVHQVIILNEGQYDYWGQMQITPVSLGAYNPITDSYAVFDTLSNVRNGSDILIDGDNIYIAADSILYVYDKNTLTLTNSKVIKGLRKLAVWNNQLLVTIGENAISHKAYFEVYDKISLNFIYELDTLNGPVYSVEGISVVNDTAYLGINNALLDFMNPTGIIGVVDLSNQSYAGEVDMGVDGKNPDNLMIDGNMIYTLNNKDFSGSSVSAFNTIDRTITTTNVSAPSGCGASVLVSDNIYYHRYIYDSLWNDVNTQVHKFNTSTQVIDSVNPNLTNLYGMVDDNLNGYLYVTNTDFVSFGMAYKMQYDGTLIDSFAVGVSPGTLALDIRTLVSVGERTDNRQIVIYPTIVQDILTLELGEAGSVKVSINNLLGQQVISFITNTESTVMNLSDLNSGVYLLSVKSETDLRVLRFVKR